MRKASFVITQTRFSIWKDIIASLRQQQFSTSATAMSSSQKEGGLSLETISEWRADLSKDEGHLIAQLACTKFETSTFLSDSRQNLSHFFNTKISTEGKPVSDQKSSGRCWIFACLNVMRIHFCKKYKVDDFEFSQSHVYFWDKVERCNYMLGSFIKLAQSGADHSDRTLHHLLAAPTNDGGQWQMLVNIIEKYGLIPRCQFPSPFLADASRRLAMILDNQLRAHCATIVKMVKEGSTQQQLDETRTSMMKSLFRVICTCLGDPPEVVEFDFYDKEKKYRKIGPLSPLDFYRQIVKPLFDMEKQVVLTNDPRPTSEYMKTYTVDYLNNMDNTKVVTYLNLPIDQLKTYAKKSIQDDKAVWFGCDVWKEFYSNRGTMALDQFSYELVMGIDLRNSDKASRLLYRDEEMTHAMVLTAVNIEESGATSKWRIENSWGDSGKAKGYISMADSWFDEYVLLVVIDRTLLDEEVIKALDQEPIVLPAWDPMGALARN